MAIEGTPSALGYTPDGEFPVVYAEKGIINADIIGKGEKFVLLGGEAYNCVTDVVRYQWPYLTEIKAKLDQNQIETALENDWLIVKGKASHRSLPERGINAALATLATYAELTTDSPIANFVKNNYTMILILVRFFQQWRMKLVYWLLTMELLRLMLKKRV
ncbi:hypothetical protein [Spiroplasma endosymbiont of Phyllotreta cruciferae]|uniref:hypothetical protein n=1 Tax=Spiroplasma endosymbiont of Phyllotreta cruciferae TaxID=2886375 RepID=UPI00209F6ECA|nr:hypothetical protein [Spiroplasma endosymbiont of Phyllotreta cruciferae]